LRAQDQTRTRAGTWSSKNGHCELLQQSAVLNDPAVPRDQGRGDLDEHIPAVMVRASGPLEERPAVTLMVEC
jgi:hypothetical protein